MSKVLFKGINKSFDIITIFSSNDYINVANELISSADRNIMEIHFPAITDFSELVGIYNNEDALSEISIIDSDQTYVHLNYVIPISLSLTRYESEKDAESFGPDRWIMKVAQLTEADKQFRKLVGIAAKSVSCLTLDEYKEEKIQISKSDLETFLKNNPLISNCKDGIYREYTVTTEKQNQFAAQFAVYTANKMAGIEDIFTWNEKGKSCIPWDEMSCIKWMNDAKSYTKPLVAAQQEYEVKIMSLTTKADVEKFNIDYSLVPTKNGDPSWLGHTTSEVEELASKN